MTDLDDLNIVAIPFQPNQLHPTKRRKNNKYERRRQKSRTAKKSHDDEQPATNRRTESHNDVSTTRRDQGHEGDKSSAIDNLNVNSVNLTSMPQHNPVDDDVKEKTTAIKEAPVVEMSRLLSANLGKVSVSVKPSSRRQPAREDKPVVVTKEGSAIQQRQLPKHTASRIVTSKGTENEEERAKYMAEFHARPRELDRRSGARSATLVSKESTHLFIDKNDWESLGIHQRLVQTIKGSQFGSLKQPTIIQSRTIQAFQQQEPQKDGERHEGKTNKHHRNVLIHSETGSGKTLAYVLPILQSLAFGNDNSGSQKRLSRSEMGCRCIILCPTRELASQTLQVLERLCQANFAGWIVPGGLLGGDSRNSEKSRLRKGLGIIVATPGRLLDHLQKTTSLAMSLKGKLQWLVLDEADRLLDMGLGDQVRQIVQWIRANEASKAATQPWWRSILVSATVSQAVQALAMERMLCGDQEWVWVKGDDGGEPMKTSQASTAQGSKELATATSDMIESPKKSSEATSTGDFAHSTPRQLQQFHLTVTAKLRLAALVAFLVQRIAKNERTVVFMGTCASVDYHYQLFAALEESLWDDSNNENGIAVSTVDGSEDANITTRAPGLFGKKAQVFKLHGSVPHARRGHTMKHFSSTDSSESGAAILLTTDVAARGLNLEAIDWTVQYDPPCEISDYVHRVGRGARAGKAGHSLLFLLPSERKYLEVLETKGIPNITALSLSSILNQAASLCCEWTQAGAKQQGSGSGGIGGGALNTNNQDHFTANSRSGEFFSSEVQYRLEECVVRDDVETRKAWKESMTAASKLQRKRKNIAKNNSGTEGKKEGQLLTMARDAFLSFLRAYPTKKEAVVKSIFSSRALHLGHIAKSFALKEPPKSLVSKHKSKRQQQQEEARDEKANLPRSFEFGDVPDDLNDLLASTLANASSRAPSYIDDAEEEAEYLPRSKKRQKLQLNGKQMSAKALLLANAAKMQNNLMDAM